MYSPELEVIFKRIDALHPSNFTDGIKDKQIDEKAWQHDSKGTKEAVSSLLHSHNESLKESIKALKRTDETQMSDDHSYDEAIDDVLSLLTNA